MSLPSLAAVAPSTDTSFARDARAGLTRPGQKRLSPKYLYDAQGSTLFEAITQLPEYGVWRAERRLLEAHARQIAELTSAATVIELGSGSAAKTALLLRALVQKQPIDYCAIDVSSAALQMTRDELVELAGLRIRTVESEYLPGLDTAMNTRTSHGPALVLLLGGSLGNLDFGTSVRFLRHIRGRLHAGDHLLLGTDLIKPDSPLLAAYDDAQGVTAAFNLNLLARMNRELGADFALTQFRHRARLNRQTHDVEMHLESLADQTVQIADFVVTLRAGESIHTESSHKYSLVELDQLADTCGFRFTERWIDNEGQFTTTLVAAV